MSRGNLVLSLTVVARAQYQVVYEENLLTFPAHNF